MIQKPGSALVARLFLKVLIGIFVVGVGLSPERPAMAGMEMDPAEQGQMIYSQNCASCHGLNGEGQPNWKRPDKQGELPAPPHDQTGHTWRHSDDMLFKMIQDGWRDPFNKTSRLTMPAFREVLSPEEIRVVIAYLKSFWTSEQIEFQELENVK